jgi:hypothetical protein
MLAFTHARDSRLVFLVLLSHASGGREELTRKPSKFPENRQPENWRFFVSWTRLAPVDDST